MKWLGRLLWIPLAIALIIFAIANRQVVVISLDPFSEDMPALGLETPLWVALFGTLMVGMVLGGIASWGAQALKAMRRSVRRRAKIKSEAINDDGGDVPIIAPEKPTPLIAQVGHHRKPSSEPLAPSSPKRALAP